MRPPAHPSRRGLMAALQDEVGDKLPGCCLAATCVPPVQAQSCGRVATNQPDGQITADFPKLESSQGIKNIPLNMSGKSPLQARPVSPDERGGSRSSRTRGGMRWTEVAAKDEPASCGRRSRVVLAPRRWRQVRGKQNFSRAMVARKPGHQGELGVSCKPPRREGRIASAEPVCSCAPSTISAHETAGAARTRSSLRPLSV